MTEQSADDMEVIKLQESLRRFIWKLELDELRYLTECIEDALTEGVPLDDYQPNASA